jgi:hypothetical protein
VLFIIMQQVQPAFIMVLMQSQQAWIISAHLASPLVHVMTQPSLVMSHLHMPMTRLQQQTIMPFIMQQQLHMPPASMLHRFCIMPQAVWSVQVQTIFMPPCIFSNFMVQRGTIGTFMAGAPVVVGIPMPVGIVPDMPIIVGFIIAVTIFGLPSSPRPVTAGLPALASQSDRVSRD